MGKTALLVIDVQYGIFERKHYDGMAVYQEDSFLETIKALIQRVRLSHIPVLYTQHIYEDLPLMKKGLPAWQVHPRVRPEPGDIIIEKRYADAFMQSDLDETLKRLGIQNLIVTGLETAYCVDTTCRRAFSMGYQVLLVSNGHSSLDSDLLSAGQIIAHHNKVLGSQFVTLKRADEIVFDSAFSGS